MALIYIGNLGDAYRYFDTDAKTYTVSQNKPSQDVLNYSNSVTTLQGQDAETGVWRYTLNSTPLAGLTLSAPNRLPENLAEVPTSGTTVPVYEATIGASSSAPLSAMSFVTDNAETKTIETTSSLLGTFGGIGEFSKLGANLPSFDMLVSGSMLAASGVAGSKITSALGSQVNSLVQGKLGSLLGATPLLGSVMDKSTSAVSSVSASQIKASAGVQTLTSSHRVSLREIGTKNYVYFEVMPQIVESHTAEYESVAPAQFPGAFQKYKGNSSTSWTVNATFISRTTEEATQNYDNLMRLRGWMKPFYGDRTGISYPKKLGAPPPVLLFEGLRDLVGPVPVVITSMNWNWPKDVDYIATDVTSPTDGNYIPFPVVLELPIQLAESYSIDQFNQFSLTDYRTGRLGPAFNNMESDVTVNVDYVDGSASGGSE